MEQIKCNGLELGTQSLPETDHFMSELVQLRMDDNIADSVLFHSYEACLAYGVRELDQDDLLKPLDYFEHKGIQLHQAARGGGLTYYWPEQLLCYPIFKLGRDEQNVSDFMYRLEEVGLRTLADFGIIAHRKRDDAAQIGLWLEGNKVASMGIHISRWVTSFGFALNLSGDASPANYIRPCGLEDVNLVTVESLVEQIPNREYVIERLIKHIDEIFGRTVKMSDQIVINKESKNGKN